MCKETKTRFNLNGKQYRTKIPNKSHSADEEERKEKIKRNKNTLKIQNLKKKNTNKNAKKLC